MTARWTRIVTAALGLTVAAGTVAAGGAATPAAAEDTTPTGDRQVPVVCEGIGEDVVTIDGDLAHGGTARITSGPLTVIGSPGFTGKDAAGRRLSVAPTGDGPTCVAEGQTRGALADLLPAAQAAKGGAGLVTGSYSFAVSVDATEPATGATSSTRSSTTEGSTAAAASSTAAFPFEAKLRDYLSTRPGAVGVAVRLPGTGRTWTYTKTSSRNVTASIVKVEIMAAVMLRAQDAGRSLTDWEKSRIVPMIRYSDNNATTELFNSLGGRAALDRASARLGLTSTYADSGGRWGLTSTTAADQARLMEHFARPGLLSWTNRSYGLTQMRSVASDQDWGVTAGPPSGYVAVKNGWLPRTDGWHVNSIGWQSYGSANYTIAVLTHDNPGAFATQISTIEGVSRIVYANRLSLLQSPPAPPAPAPRGVSGDVDGDGEADLLTLSDGGYLYLWKGDGSGGFAAKQALRSGLGAYDWAGIAGDLNRDRRTDVLLRSGSDLYVMLSSSSGLGTPTKVGTYFGGYTDLTSGHDVDGDGQLDLIGRRAGGEIIRFELSDRGVPTKEGSMGTPVQWYPNLSLVADLNGDGRADLRGVSSGGRMRAWTSRATSWAQTDATSTGWDAYELVETPGDLNGSSTHQDDVAAITPGGTLRVWWGTTGGAVSGPVSTGLSAAGMSRIL